ncbi:hypothetical protein CONCODRAFT_11756 [Conidiobolus coronatus NRRL 28638]|uniref:Homeobox domain-containing protein n=1 Tax=Conidiobolus coronatus (strain ATCC 28846 / CBS 209.66 / NRRL 28638) TaxID=796925 RepID=A0A137NUR7_CONC2|nr:hypothetical protein CONCODRAFT_11756 [Conidiobolus coronatus NRRL 28638]|eukprot:KXN66411.1 hypothetical protein CONCODRAFT_11756 [Conidiobolus coronatus NRRL 28638]
MKLSFITHEEAKPINSESKEKTFNQTLKLAPILPHLQRIKQRESSLPSLRKLKIYEMGQFYAYAKHKMALPSPINSNFESSSSCSSSPEIKTIEIKYDNSRYKPHRSCTPEGLPHISRLSLSKRTSISKQQTSILNEYYNLNHYPNQDEKLKLAKLLKLSERTIQIWFQNRRQNRKTKYSFLRD